MVPRVLITAAVVILAALPLLHAAEQPGQGADMGLFQRVMGIVKSEYVEPVTDQKLIAGALAGMVNSLDPHSSYMTEDAYDEMKVQTRGAYGGLGLEITEENNQIKVVSPIDDTPAAAAGLKPGDVITKIDGKPIGDLTLPEVVSKLRGDIGSEVKMTIARIGREPFDVTLKRANITIRSVKSHVERGKVGYLRITSFIENTGSELAAAIAAIQKQGGAKIVGYVLDLRNDPGGLVDQAVDVADDFLDKGEIVAIRGRDPDESRTYDAKPGDLVKGAPLVVLINGGSASASEIVAGALHDDHRALLLGTRSFGKGSVQTIIPLGGKGALRLTTALYYTPSNHSIQAEGIRPDIVVEPARIERLAEAPVEHEADLRNALKNTDKAAVAGAPAGSSPAPAQPVPPPNVPPGTKPAASPKPEVEANVIGTEQDYQLSRAVDLLTGIALFAHAGN